MLHICITLFLRNLKKAMDQPWPFAERFGTNMSVLVDADKLETNFNMTLKLFPLKEYDN